MNAGSRRMVSGEDVIEMSGVETGVLGYALVVAKKGETRCAEPTPVDRPVPSP
jgi:hypothetical protein